MEAYEHELQELHQQMDLKDDMIAAQESVLLKNNLTLPPMGRRARDDRKTQPLKRKG